MSNARIQPRRTRLRPVLALAAISAALPAWALDEAQMQQMMEKAQQMQTCMADLDRGAIEQMKQDSEELMQQVAELCKAGKRDEAQAQAVAFGLRVAGSEEMQKMRKCGDMMQGSLPMPGLTPEALAERGHICDP